MLMSIGKPYWLLAGWLGVGVLTPFAAWAVPAPLPCPKSATCVTKTASGVGTNNTQLAAQAIFQISGSNLIVTLSNISLDDVGDPADVLTGLAFTLKNSSNTLVNLTRVSAVITDFTDVFYDPQGQPAGDVVGGEWSYLSSISFHGAQQGISSAGLGIFGQANFPGPNLAGTTAVNGVQYGLLSSGDVFLTGNGGITGSGGLIKNTVQFTFSGATGVLLNSPGVLNVGFQYGTALNEPYLHNVPAPGTAALLGLGLLGLILSRRRRSS